MTAGFPLVGIDRELYYWEKAGESKGNLVGCDLILLNTFRVDAAWLLGSRPPPHLGSSCINAHPQLSLSLTVQRRRAAAFVGRLEFYCISSGRVLLALISLSAARAIERRRESATRKRDLRKAAAPPPVRVITLHCRCGSLIYTPRFAYFENFPAAELLMRLKVWVTPTYFTRLSLPHLRTFRD